MIRAFIAVRIKPDMARKISEVQSELEQCLAGIRWVRKENLHLTIKFLGAIEEDKIMPIMGALEEALRPIPRFSIVGRGIGVFPGIKRARVLWVGLEGEALISLAKAVEGVLEPIGFERERRAFSSHLTIGRWRDFETQSVRLKQEIERWKDHSFGESGVEEAVFFRSILKPQGAEYSPLGIIPLGNQPVSNRET